MTMRSVLGWESAGAGDVLRATAREVYRQGRNGIYDIVVTDQAGAAVAHFRGKSRTIGGPVVPEAAPSP